MEQWFFQVAKDYGLFVALVIYVLLDSRRREINYIEIIDKLSDAFQELKHDVADIKKKLGV